MKRYTVTFTYTYEIEAKTEAEARTIAEKQGVLIDGECFIEKETK